ncbi:MAG: hypothetical protein V9E87_01240 [Gemmatimonadales bacterium]
MKLGGGPVLSRGAAVNPVLFDLLVETATAEGIPFTVQGAAKYTGTDADAIFTARGGVGDRRWSRCRSATCTRPTSSRR